VVAEVTVLVLAPIGVWLLYVLARRVYLREQIKRHGVLTDATVVDVYVVPERGGARMVAVYKYLDQAGGSHKGESPELIDDAHSGAIPGSRCKIRFDTDHPERSVWISDASSALPLA